MSAFRSLFAQTLRVAAALVLISAVAAQAQQPLPKPEGRSLLDVTGKIAVTNAPEKASFDLKMLESLGVARTKTSTAWTEGQPAFEGVSVKALLDRLGAKGDTVIAIALNDYKVEIPIEDFNKYPVILAYRMNGELLRVRDKGPLWIVYPQDEFPTLKNKETQSKWVWQVKELRIR
jgi:hypothetical protein